MALGLGKVLARDLPYLAQINHCELPLLTFSRPEGAANIQGSTRTNSGIQTANTMLETIDIYKHASVGKGREKQGTMAASRKPPRNKHLKIALSDSVTHELRTPLTSIKASVTALITNSEMSLPQRNELLVCKRLSKRFAPVCTLSLNRTARFVFMKLGKSGSNRWLRSVPARARLAISPGIRVGT